MVTAGLIAGAMFLAAFGQSLTGFGGALISVPLLALLLGPVTAVVTATLLFFLLSIGMAIQLRRSIDLPAMRAIVPTGILGLPVGLLLLRWVDPRWLSLGIGVVVLVFTLALIRGLVLTGRASALTAGFVSGALLTSTGMNGPPLVIAFQARGLSPEHFRATLQAAFGLFDSVAIAGFAITGVLTPTAGRAVLIGLLPGCLGWYLGGKLVRRVDATLFRRLVLTLLAVTGLVAVTTAVLG